MTGDGRIPFTILGDEEAMPSDLADRCDEGACLAVGVDRHAGWSVYRHIAAAPIGSRRHGGLCPCCVGQGDLVTSLNQLFLDRVRGICPQFSYVILACESCRVEGIRELLQQDTVFRARYRI